MGFPRIKCGVNTVPHRLLFHPGRFLALRRQLEDREARVGAVDHVDIAAVVGLHVVALNGHLAVILTVNLDAALIGRFRDRRNEVADFPPADEDHADRSREPRR